MNLKKIFNYFILRPLSELIVNFTNIFNSNIFVIVYNFLNFLSFNNKYLHFKDKIYFIKDRRKKWFFSHKTRAWVYFKGLKNRSEELKNEYLLKNIPIKKNDTVIDCGANVGDFFLCFNKKINYIGIEPSPKEFFVLKKNIVNQTLINKALWKKSINKKTFFVSSEDADSSLIKINKFEKKIKIDTVTLDELLKNKNKRIKLLKLEAEGAEPEILYGLNKKIHLIDYISIDAGFERGKSLESTLVPCINYLNKKNFELIGYSNTRIVILFKNKRI
ncbi:FkbM family methyltransferase [Candidatus Pelagibacter ubique]|nr:FkbM family methyltransferase [Candidatus Pelagibacter ubique]